MVKSGRLNAMKGFIGKLLRVKPIVTVNNKGIPELFGKPLTEKSSRKMVVRTIEKKIKSRKLWGGYSITHANNPSTADWYAREIEKNYRFKTLFYTGWFAGVRCTHRPRCCGCVIDV